MEDVVQHESFRRLETAVTEEGEKEAKARSAIVGQLGTLREALEELAGQIEAEELNAESRSTASRDSLAAFKAYVQESAQLDTVSGERIEALESELKEFKEARETWNELRLNLEKECGEQQAAAHAAQERVTALEQELETERAQEETHRKGEQELEQQCSEFQAAAAAAQEKVEGLEKALEAAQGEAAEARERFSALEAQVEAMQSQEGEAKQALEEATEKLDKMSSQGTEAQTALEAAQAEASQSKEALAALQERFQALEAQEAQGKEAAADSEAKTARLEEQVDQGQALVSELRASLEAAPKAEALQALQAELESVKQEAVDLSQELEGERSKSRKSVLAVQLAEALKEAEDAQEELHEVKAKLAALSHGHADKVFDAVPAEAEDAEAVEEQKRIREVLEHTDPNKKRTMGELLVEAQIVSADQLSEALEIQKQQPNTHLGAILIEKEWATEEAVAEALASQCAVDFIHLNEAAVDLEAASLLTERLAKLHTCIPLSANEVGLRLAIANPLDLVAIEDIERATNRKVEVVVATPKEINAVINHYYWEPE